MKEVLHFLSTPHKFFQPRRKFALDKEKNFQTLLETEIMFSVVVLVLFMLNCPNSQSKLLNFSVRGVGSKKNR